MTCFRRNRRAASRCLPQTRGPARSGPGTVRAGLAGALAAQRLGARGQAIDIRGTLAELAVRVPVRFILGHRDRIIDWRESLDVSPRIAVHHLPQAGHMPHWEAPGDVVAILATATEDP